MSVDVTHQRFATHQPGPKRVVEALRDSFLQTEMQDVGRAFCRVVQFGAESQQKVVGGIDPPLIRSA